MDLINVAVARAVWTFDIAEFNSPGLRWYPDVIGQIRQHYEFDPEPSPPTLESRWKLLNGGFEVKNKSVVPVAVQIYTDGVSAETTSNTNDADAFLEDLFGWLETDLGLNYHAGLIKQKGYQSELVVRSNMMLGKVSGKFQRFGERLSTVPLFGKVEPQELAAIYFGASEKSASSFTVERKAATPFQENKFYCRAPLATTQHLALLKEFESMMSELPN